MPRTIRAIAATVSSVAVCAATLVAVPLAAADEPAPAIAPEECPVTVNVAGAQCGHSDTPMRYDDPTGPKISIGYIRIPAADPSARKGVIFGNPGGPGVDAYSYFGTEGMGFTWPQEIRNEYDLVAVQPRGLLRSTPLECKEPNPQDPIESAKLDIDTKIAFGAVTRSLCQGDRPGYPETITTENNARDWDAARRALGYDTINIMGVSYGTYLGAAYATMFPEHTDRVVLDSAMDPSLSWQALIRTQQAGYENALNDYFTFVANNDETYHMGDTPLKAYQYWSDRIVEETGTNPTVAPPPARIGDLPAGLEFAGQLGADTITAFGKARVETDGIISRLLNPGANQAHSGLLVATQINLPSPQAWDILARSTNGTLEDSGQTTLSEDVQEEIKAEGTAMSQLQSNQLCNENVTPPDYGLLPAALWSSLVSGDIFTAGNAVIGSGMYCSGATPVTGVIPLDGSQLAVRPLQISGTGDPKTVYSNHTAIADAMGAHVVTVHGPGHGHVGLGNPAVNQIVLDYLRTGDVEVTDAPGYFDAQ